jgi:hypothetical protein
MFRIDRYKNSSTYVISGAGFRNFVVTLFKEEEFERRDEEHPETASLFHAGSGPRPSKYSSS